MVPVKKLEKILNTASGIERIVSERWKEEDNLDFKREVNRREPKWQGDLRVDCAALASTGVGFLIIGIDETRDGFNRAEAIHPVQEPTDTKKAIEHVLADGLSPPLKRWEVWIVETTQGPVIVVRIEGALGYPVEIMEPPPKKQRYYLRGGGQNHPLSAEDARLRRRAFDVRTERIRILRISAIPIVFVIGITVFGFDLYRRHREENLAVDADMCGDMRTDGGGIGEIDNTLHPLKAEADAAIWTGDVQECWRTHEKLLAAHPQHPWRYFWAGQCKLLAGETRGADTQFVLSEQITEIARRRRPRCSQFKFLQALNEYARKREAEACKLLKEFHDLHAEGLRYSRGSHPPMQRLSVTCPGMMDVLADLGLAISAVELNDVTKIWPFDEAQRSRVLARTREINEYDMLVCLKACPVESVALEFHTFIAPTGVVLKAGPSADLTPGAGRDRYYLNCVGRMMLDWKYPPHTFVPGVDVGG